MHPAGFEPATPASNRPQTLASNGSATGIGIRSPAIQPAASRYFEYAMPSPVNSTVVCLTEQLYVYMNSYMFNWTVVCLTEQLCV